MTDNDLFDARVGDTLVLVTPRISIYRDHQLTEEAVVTRVGTKYLYITCEGYELSERFSRRTGAEDTEAGRRRRLYTPAQYEDMNQRASLTRDLREAGLELNNQVSHSLSTQRLRDLLAVLKP